MITLKTLPNASAQEVFDQIVNHLLTQNEKCRDSKTYCRYKFGNLKCAAGCLIADDEYSDRMEGYSWAQLIKNNTVPDVYASLISDLQIIHDQFSVGNWKSGLEDCAKNNNLKFNYK